MRTLVMGAFGTSLVLAATAAPALAQTAIAPTIGAADAKSHVGQTAIVEAAVSDVRTARSGVTFIDMDGRYPDNRFVAVIFVSDLAKFPGVQGLAGKTVTVSGPVELYQGRPEIILRSAEQLQPK
jgi:hypothetical protein